VATKEKVKKQKPLQFRPELLNAMKGYKPKFILNDIFAGLMVALVALPLNMAMGVRQAEGSPYAIQIGLWAAIIGGILLALFGGTRFSIGGPTAPFITITVILLGTNSGYGLHGLFFAVVLGGVFLIIAGFLRAGRLLKYVSFPVMIGICLGIGIMLFFNLLSDVGFMLAPHTDLTRTLDNITPFTARLVRTVTNFNNFSISSFIIGAFVILLVYFIPRIPKVGKKIPAMITAIALGTVLSIVFTAIYNATNISWIQPRTIYSVFGNPEPAWGEHLLRWNLVNFANPMLYFFAFAIAIVAALEGMMSSQAVENISGLKYSADMEIIGHGVANVGSGLLGGLPITAAMARTNLNYANRAKSNLAAIFQSLFLLLFYVVLMQFMGIIPLAALAAPLIKVAIATSFFPIVKCLFKFTNRDTIQLVVTSLVTIIFGVHFGVIAGIAISFIVNSKSIKDKMTVEDIEFEKIPNIENFCEHFECEEELPIIKAFTISGTVFFANTYKITDKIKEAIANGADEVVLDFSNATSIDATVAEKLAKYSKALAKKGKRLALFNTSKDIKRQYEQAFRYIVMSW